MEDNTKLVNSSASQKVDRMKFVLELCGDSEERTDYLSEWLKEYIADVGVINDSWATAK